MKLGEVSKYIVLRETDLGFMLKSTDVNDENEYFLHRNETNFKILHVDDRVNAFLYLDKQKRPSLTLYEPLATINKGSLCEAVSMTEAGTFFNIGISKDILLSSDDYRGNNGPRKGDKLPVKLRLRGNSIFIKLLNKEEILALSDGFRYANNEKTFGYVYRITKDGINLVDEHYNVIFIHKNNLRNEHRLGEKVEFSIIGSKEMDGYFDYYGTCIQNKEHMLEDDCQVILDYLDNHAYVMNYTEDSDPLVIEKVFHMSKSAFKRAIGHLYKEEKIILFKNKIALKR